MQGHRDGTGHQQRREHRGPPAAGSHDGYVRYSGTSTGWATTGACGPVAAGTAPGTTVIAAAVRPRASLPECSAPRPSGAIASPWASSGNGTGSGAPPSAATSTSAVAGPPTGSGNTQASV